MKLNVTILEDETIHAVQLQQLLVNWGKKNDIPISTRHYLYAKDFLEEKIMTKMNSFLLILN